MSGLTETLNINTVWEKDDDSTSLTAHFFSNTGHELKSVGLTIKFNNLQVVLENWSFQFPCAFTVSGISALLWFPLSSNYCSPKCHLGSLMLSLVSVLCRSDHRGGLQRYMGTSLWRAHSLRDPHLSLVSLRGYLLHWGHALFILRGFCLRVARQVDTHLHLHTGAQRSVNLRWTV